MNSSDPQPDGQHGATTAPGTAATQPEGDSQPSADVPPGNHPLEIAARIGIGPLSPLAQQTWHGQAKPCVTCGQLVRRDAVVCAQCGQDLTDTMIEKMKAHAGPWYVLEHVRPFPGVNLDRIIRQIRRGLITPTSIVRGPSTDFHWRFAIETPGLSRYFGRCWHCHEQVAPSDSHCKQCLSYLFFEKAQTVAATPAAQPPASPHNPEARDDLQARARMERPAPTGTMIAEDMANPPPASPEPEPEGASALAPLRELSAAVGRRRFSQQDPIWDEPPRIAGIRATWVAVVLVTIVIVGLLFLTRSRSETIPPSPTPTAAMPTG